MAKCPIEEPQTNANSATRYRNSGTQAGGQPICVRRLESGPLSSGIADGSLVDSKEWLTMSRTYEVEARWDSEAEVWVAESEDIPGLVAEAESMNALVEKVRILVPELFELNGGLEPGQKSVNVLVRAHYEETASVPVGS
jgi:hypothetical protein